MNRLKQSTSSNNSGTSSETSETQSVDDQQSTSQTNVRVGSASLSRAKNSWKRMKDLAADKEKEKDNEAKRPPWRAVSVSTLTKPDKSALLRAKLLDASRRLRAGKANVALQTDFVPTKLMKEASFGVQKDLILHRDIGILTDGQLSKKKDGEKYVLTYSMSQMTDTVPTTSRQTQTLLPKAYNKDLINSYLTSDEDGNVNISDVEKRLGDQIAKIRKLNLNESERQHTSKSKNNTNLAPTLASWHFDDDAVEMESDRHFIPYIIESYKPWRSFVPFPFRLRGNTLIGTQKIDWYALLQSIDDLIKESNNLVDKLEQIMLENRVHRKSVLGNLGKIQKFKPSSFTTPSDQWLPLIEQQEKQLQIMLNTNEATYETSESEN
ncbi:uncharacterized protein LOC110189028 [Drosophila serrata]|uniref:uncharacterized protein LOC110189028 n=1 Tax=Drosophila serrata TaxID=7274 RepID=UPI000A1D03D3|nr:uncharacterized protein LOC110189028 [Drosophila serrata]